MAAVHGATVSGELRHASAGQKIARWLSKVFELNPAGLNWPRAVLFLDIALVPMVVLATIGYQLYLLSALLGLLTSWLIDPGGSYGQRAWHIAGYGLVGAGVTALAFGIGGDAWGWLVLAALAVTLVAGLAVTFGVHRFVAATLLNLWFLIALAVAFSLHQHPHITSYTWAQVAAWAGGSALWIVIALIEWLARGRRDRPQPVAELPGDTSRRHPTRPIVMFAAIRALAIAGASALAFGLNLPHGYWMPIATLVAMKPDLGSSTLIATQRVAGAAIGAGAAALLLLIPANESGLRLLAIVHGLEIVAIVLLMHAAATRMWNYAVYYAAISAGVLILLDLPQPGNFDAVGYRVAWAAAGVGIGLLVMFLAGLLARSPAKAKPQPAHDRRELAESRMRRLARSLRLSPTSTCCWRTGITPAGCGNPRARSSPRPGPRAFGAAARPPGPVSPDAPLQAQR